MEQDLQISDGDFKEKVLDKSGLVMVDFWAAWCGPCHMIAPTIEKLAEEWKGQVDVYKLEVDHNPQTASQFKVMSIPTVLLFKDGQIVEQLIGAQSEESFRSAVSKHQ